MGYQALSFSLRVAEQLSYSNEHFYEENVNVYQNLTQGTTAIAACAVWLILGLRYNFDGQWLVKQDKG